MFIFPPTEYSPFHLQGKLYDYWKPLPGDIHHSPEEQEVGSSDGGAGPVSEEGNEEESSSSEEKDVYSEEDNNEEKDAMSDSQETEDDTKSDKADGAAELKGWTAGRDSPGQMSAQEADEVSEADWFSVALFLT